MGTLAALGDRLEFLLQEVAASDSKMVKLVYPGMHMIRSELYQLDQEFDRLQVQNKIMRDLIIAGIKAHRSKK